MTSIWWCVGFKTPRATFPLPVFSNTDVCLCPVNKLLRNEKTHLFRKCVLKHCLKISLSWCHKVRWNHSRVSGHAPRQMLAPPTETALCPNMWNIQERTHFSFVELDVSALCDITKALISTSEPNVSEKRARKFLSLTYWSVNRIEANIVKCVSFESFESLGQ